MSATYTGETTPTWIDKVLRIRLQHLIEEGATDEENAQFQNFAYFVGPALLAQYYDQKAALMCKDSGPDLLQLDKEVPEGHFHLYLTDQHRLKKCGDVMVVSLKGDPE